MVAQPERAARGRRSLRAQFGLDDPVWQRYFRWLCAMLNGDWGFSFISRVDVDKLILAARAGDAGRDRRLAGRWRC